MKAFGIIKKPSQSEQVPLVTELDIEVPIPSRNEVLIRTMATTINPDDIYSIRGTVFGGIPMFLFVSKKRPFIPGMDVSGIVHSTGANVDKFKVGDKVYGFIPPWQRIGSWSEFVAVHTKYLHIVPEGWSFAQAAANGVAGATASNAVADLDYTKIKSVLVVGASGGIGSVITQILSNKGLHVIGVCSQSNAQIVKNLGAELVVDYHDGELYDLLDKKFHNLDVVIDCVGGSEIEAQAKKILDNSGVFITLVGPEKQVGNRPLGFHFFTLICKMAFKMALGSFSSPKYKIVNGSLHWSNIEQFQIATRANTVISKELGFSKNDFQEGITIVASHHTRGKIVHNLEVEHSETK